MKPVVRRLTPSDHLAIAALWHSSWHDAHASLLPQNVVQERTVETFASRLEELAQDSFIAVLDGIPIAFGAIHENEVGQFYVASAYRGTGVAKLLLSVLEGELRARGVVDAHIQCAHGNRRAHAFYVKNGWTDTGLWNCPLWTPDGRVETHPTHLFAKRLGS